MIFDREPFHSKHIFAFLPLLCLFLLSLLSLAGCTRRDPRNNQLDSDTFSVNFKVDSTSSSGKKAAFYDNRIYYLSSELGTQGIYSMDPSGEDIMLEISVEDIRAISLQDDVLYYSGFAGVKENYDGPYRQFRLFSRGKGETVSKDFLASAIYTDDLRDENVWDFYLSRDGILVLRITYIAGYPRDDRLSVVTFVNHQAISNPNYQLLNNGPVNQLVETNGASLLFLCKNNLYYAMYTYADERYSPNEELTCWGVPSVYDASQRKVALPLDRRNSLAATTDNSYSRAFCRVDSKRAIFSTVRGLESYDMASNISTDIVTFSPTESLYNQLDFGDYILVFTERLRSSYLNGIYSPHTYTRNRALKESLYRVNPDTGEKVLLLTVGRNQSFLYADRNIAATAKGKLISIYDISKDTPVLLRTIPLKHSIVDRANKVDSAGGWLFLYRFNEETQRDELIEKVNLAS